MEEWGSALGDSDSLRVLFCGEDGEEMEQRRCRAAAGRRPWSKEVGALVMGKSSEGASSERGAAQGCCFRIEELGAGNSDAMDREVRRLGRHGWEVPERRVFEGEGWRGRGNG
jgi:hypothetical protein